MMKVALLTATLLVAAATPPALAATRIPPDAGNQAAGESACHLVQSLELACALRSAGRDGSDTIPAAELDSLEPTLPAASDWAALHASTGAGLDFKDAANDPSSVLPATLERDSSNPIVPATLALGAMVILLGRRPIGF